MNKMSRAVKVTRKTKNRTIIIAAGVLAVVGIGLLISFCFRKPSYTPISTTGTCGQQMFDKSGRDILHFENANTFAVKFKGKELKMPMAIKDFGSDLKLEISDKEQKKVLDTGAVTDMVKASIGGHPVSVAIANVENTKKQAKDSCICSIYVSAKDDKDITLPCDVSMGDSMNDVIKKYGKPQQTYSEGSTKINRWVSYRQSLIEIGEQNSKVVSLRIMPASEG